MSRFLGDTSVTPLGAGSYAATMDTGWWIVNGPNGGYVAAVVARAMVAEVGSSLLLRSLSLHYLRPPAEGPVQIDVTVERQGRSVASISARLHQGDRLLVVALGAVAAPREAAAFDDVVAPVVPAPESIDAPIRPEGAPTIPMNDRYEVRPCVGSAEIPWRPGLPPAPAVSGGWLRFAEPTPVDEIALVAMTDAWFPPVFHRLPDAPLAVPTVDLTVHIRRLPADPSDWVLVRFSSPLAVDGYLVEDGELWDRHGNLLAVSRQLAVLA